MEDYITLLIAFLVICAATVLVAIIKEILFKYYPTIVNKIVKFLDEEDSKQYIRVERSTLIYYTNNQFITIVIL